MYHQLHSLQPNVSKTFESQITFTTPPRPPTFTILHSRTNPAKWPCATWKSNYRSHSRHKHTHTWTRSRQSVLGFRGDRKYLLALSLSSGELFFENVVARRRVTKSRGERRCISIYTSERTSSSITLSRD